MLLLLSWLRRTFVSDNPNEERKEYFGFCREFERELLDKQENYPSTAE